MGSKRNTEENNLLVEKLNSNSELGKPIERDSNKFGDILGKNWKVFRVSPIYNLSRNKLRFYEKILDEEINSIKKETSCICYKSKLTLNKNLRLNEQCAEALQVEIIKNDSQSPYVGHFISWSNAKPGTEKFVSLPILLANGQTSIMGKVHSSLCKIFDCDIQPAWFSFLALNTFFVKHFETSRKTYDVGKEQVTMEYRIPGCKDNDKIKVSLPLETIIVIFAVVMDSLKQEYQGITSEQVILEFYKKVLNHIYQVYKMDLMLAELYRIDFPDAFLTNNGQLKISTFEAAITTMEILQTFTPLDSITNV